ncbi:LysR family transcriptional regulator [Sphingobium amiense]|uniref:LysR family transcriptional regulator n=1 Tax=Sphingobium amiense TaxID=135719 RepID=A0A494WG45_9SPHN|nr:LysR family transcriptional regulator [Sphingobium amiense]BBD99885.1 LysR family transcriptional regulator [Sphingobium amiense]
MHSPPLRQLDIFAQMVAAGDAARCASDLGIDVDLLLQELESLELRLGYRLFDDPGGRARLTEAGHKTARAMTLLSQDEDASGLPEGTPEARTTAAPAIVSSRCDILLAAPPPVFGHIQEALAAFEAANDDIAITLDLHVHDAAQAAAALASGRADIAYFYALEEPQAPASRYGWSEPLNLYAGDTHVLAQRDSVGRDALASVPQIALEAGNGVRAITDAALYRARADPGPAVVESDNMADILAALRAGRGLFAAFGPLARDVGRMAGVRRLALDVPLPSIEIRQAVSAAAADKPAAQALADFLFL